MSNLARYYKPTGKGVATRYGVGQIGAVHDPKGRISGVDTSEVVAITEDEYTRFSRAYDRQVREGALVEVSAEEHKAFLAKHAAAAQPDKAHAPSKGSTK